MTEKKTEQKKKGLSPVEKDKLKLIMADPVLWAKVFVVALDPATKKYGPWIARDYQAEVIRNRDLRKVYRFGRRLGKSELMIIDGLWQAMTHKNFRILYITPYENQVQALFRRMREIVHESPLIKSEVVSMKSSPHTVEFSNGSVLLGFTTGASTGGEASGIRGQRADWLFLDELDYMGPNDYAAVSAIANERADIGITCSSTPTGKRGIFFDMCTNPVFGYTHWHFPSQRSPLWTQEMEDRARKEYTAQEYDHEVLAEFGTEEVGVFDKDALDHARQMFLYSYEPLTGTQKRTVPQGAQLFFFLFNESRRAPYNIYRTCGVDFDKYQSGSSIIILDYDMSHSRFWVMKRIEVPRSEYTLTKAVDEIIRINDVYSPSYIFMDRGYGDTQLEMLHRYGEEHPHTGLKNKVEGFQFAQTINVPDPTQRTFTKMPMKPFMVNRLAHCFEQNRMCLSPFDDILYKQLIDYVVERISQSGQPVFTSKNEHYVDALGLAYLAFVLRFPDLVGDIQEMKYTNKIEQGEYSLGEQRLKNEIRSIESVVNPWGKSRGLKILDKSPDERETGKQWIKLPPNTRNLYSPSRGSREFGRFSGGSSRSIW